MEWKNKPNNNVKPTIDLGPYQPCSYKGSTPCDPNSSACPIEYGGGRCDNRSCGIYWT